MEIANDLIKERSGGGEAAAEPAAATNQAQEQDDIDPADLEALETDEPAENTDDTSRDDFKVRLRDGKEITIGELKKGFLPDYETRTKELSEFKQTQERFAQEREQFESQRGQFSSEAQNYKQAIDAAIVVAEHYLPKPPSNDLLKQDPFAYMEQKADYESRLTQLQQLQQQKAQIAQAEQSKQQEALKQHYIKQNQSLMAAKPELKDPAKAAKFWGDVKQLGARVGFHEHEMAQVSDYRILLMAEKAIKYDRLIDAKAKLADKAKNAEPMAPPVASPARRVSAGERQSAEVSRLQTRYDRTGDLSDLAALIDAERAAR
jgi:hypothetical protein